MCGHCLAHKELNEILDRAIDELKSLAEGDERDPVIEVASYYVVYAMYSPDGMIIGQEATEIVMNTPIDGWAAIEAIKRRISGIRGLEPKSIMILNWQRFEDDRGNHG